MKQNALSIDLEHYDDIVRSIADLAKTALKTSILQRMRLIMLC